MTHPLAPTTPIVSIDIGGLYVNTGKFYLGGLGYYYIKANTSTNLNLMSSYAPSGAQFQWLINNIEILKIGPTGIVMNNNNITLGTGTVSAASYNTTSDYRIKENAAILDETFSVDKLRPVTYTNLNSGKQVIRDSLVFSLKKYKTSKRTLLNSNSKYPRPINKIDYNYIL